MINLALYPVLFGNVGCGAYEKGSDYELYSAMRYKIFSLMLHNLMKGTGKVLISTKDCKKIESYPYLENLTLHGDLGQYKKGIHVAELKNVENFNFFELCNYYMLSSKNTFWKIEFINDGKIGYILHCIMESITEIKGVDFDVVSDAFFGSYTNDEPFCYLKWDDFLGFKDYIEDLTKVKLLEEDEGIIVYWFLKFQKSISLIKKHDFFEEWFDNDLFYIFRDYSHDRWNYHGCDSLIFSLPIAKDWIEFKTLNSVENGELEKRADYIISKLDSLQSVRYFSYFSEYEFQWPYAGENSNVLFSFFLREADLVFTELRTKYKFTKKRKIRFKDIKQVLEEKKI